jgi:hypothetical protein
MVVLRYCLGLGAFSAKINQLVKLFLL